MKDKEATEVQAEGGWGGDKDRTCRPRNDLSGATQYRPLRQMTVCKVGYGPSQFPPI